MLTRRLKEKQKEINKGMLQSILISMVHLLIAFNVNWSTYRFQRTYHFENVDIKRNIKKIEKSDSRLYFSQMRKSPYCFIRYQYQWGVIVTFDFRLIELEKNNKYDLELFLIQVNRKKEADSLKYFDLFDSELKYRIETANAF